MLGRDRLFEHQAQGQPVLGHVGDAVRDRVPIAADRDRHALQAYLAAAGGAHAEQRQRKLGATRTEQAGHAEDFAGSQIEGDAGEVAIARQVLHGKHDRGAGQIGNIRRVMKVPAGHQRAKPAAGHLGGRVGPELAAVAQHGHPVGNVQHLVQAVADKDDGDPPPRQFAGQRQQRIDLVARERGGRLVHDDQPRLRRQRPADRDQLTLRYGEIGDLGARIECYADPLHHRRGGLADAAPVDAVQAPQVAGEGDVSRPPSGRGTATGPGRSPGSPAACSRPA